ncbi:sigma factor [Streptomyces sp. NPDC006655]|uniref:RNA polymerase sigma factor n=1 Tax=Streptomyces sp. NPDC006655 TaxID=3156898 RepID=UPI003453F811
MIDLTVEQIRAAAANDLQAVTEVLAALEPRIGQLANKYAANGGVRNHDLAEDLEQEGRVAVWQCIARFEGDSVAQFFTYIDRTLRGVMDDKRRCETRPGVSEDTARRFERCLTVCAGDPYEAEREAQRVDGCLGRERLSREMAYAARLSWQGLRYLDAPIPAGPNMLGDPSEQTRTLVEVVADKYVGIPDDLADSADIERGHRKAIKEAVHATLNRMGRQQAFVLKATYGIDPVPPMDTDREIGEALGLGEKVSVRSIRARGHARFRELYLAGAAGAEVTA